MIRKICFDVDGTLITTDKDPQPRKDVLSLLYSFHKLGWQIWVHSGGGVSYASHWVQKLELDKDMMVHLAPKGSPDHEYDIAVDDAIDPTVVVDNGTRYYVKAKYFINV